MPNWKQILDEIRDAGSTHDFIRRKYLKRLRKLTGRNVIVYYSGWLNLPSASGLGALFAINDHDKIGFMSACYGLKRDVGLDLVLHTPGGEVAATESIVDYLRQMFRDIRVLVPQLALSAGTMLACSARSVVMGKQSSLGPIDPQLGGIPCHGVLEEFKRAREEVLQNPNTIPIWRELLAKYPPAFIGECQQAIAWSEQIVRQWLISGMFCTDADPEVKADRIVAELGSHAVTLSHSRHIPVDRCIELGFRVERLEDSQDLQDAVLSVHHACMHTLSSTPAVKIIENHDGLAVVQNLPKSISIPM